MTATAPGTVTTRRGSPWRHWFSGVAGGLLVVGAWLPWQRIPDGAPDWYVESLTPGPWWQGQGVVLAFGLVMLSVFVSVAPRRRSARVRLGVGVVVASLLVAWVLWNSAQQYFFITWDGPPPDWATERHLAPAGVYVTWVGLALAAISGVAWAVPERRES